MNYRFVTLAGHRFSRAHNCILEVYARSRKYTSNIWVPSAVAELLQLSLKHVNDIGVRLCFDDTITCVYYHISQFDLDEVAIQDIWREFKQKHIKSLPLHCSPVVPTPSSTCTPHDEPHAETHEESYQLLPRNTNGERFDHAIEQQILEKYDLKTLGSCYWVTPDEASGIYNAPLQSVVLKEQRLIVEVPLPSCVFPIKYYHCSGSVRPWVFTTETCRRYDPYNFYGNFYKTKIAVRMKHYALRHDCLHAPRWITLGRVKQLGCSVNSNMEPFIFTNSQNKSCQLVNIALTNRPEYLERFALEWTKRGNEHLQNEVWEPRSAHTLTNTYINDNIKWTGSTSSITSVTTTINTPESIPLTLPNSVIVHKANTTGIDVETHTNADSTDAKSDNDNELNNIGSTSYQDVAVHEPLSSTRFNTTNSNLTSCVTKECPQIPSIDLYQRNLERVRNSINKLTDNMKVSVT